MRYLVVITTLIMATAASGRADMVPAADGAELYALHCAGCHERLDKTEKPDRPASRILSAIRFMPSMADLNDLSAEEVDAIAQALRQSDS